MWAADVDPLLLDVAAAAEGVVVRDQGGEEVGSDALIELEVGEVPET